MEPSRRTLLRLLGSAGVLGGLGVPMLGRAVGESGGCRLIVVKAYGGWDVTYAIDPKLGEANIDGPDLDEDPEEATDVEALQTFSGLPIVVNDFKRPDQTTFFQNWAASTLVVNGLWTGSIAHGECTVRMATGSRSETSSDTIARVALAHGLDAPLPYMDLAGSGFYGDLAAITGQTGTSNQIKFLLDRTEALLGPVVNYPQLLLDDTDRGALDTFLASRRTAFEASRVRSAPATARWTGYGESVARADRMRTEGADFADTLQFGRTRDFDGQIDLAINLLTSGLTHSIGLDAGGAWDTHADNIDQHPNWNGLFAGLNRLLTELQTASLLDSTVVLVMSEMTRTPKRNADDGKDHWPSTSAMLMGGPITGGRAIGATNGSLDASAVDLSTGLADASGTVPQYDHFAAGVLALLDVDPEPYFGNLEVLGGLSS